MPLFGDFRVLIRKVDFQTGDADSEDRCRSHRCDHVGCKHAWQKPPSKTQRPVRRIILRAKRAPAQPRREAATMDLQKFSPRSTDTFSSGSSYTSSPRSSNTSSPRSPIDHGLGDPFATLPTDLPQWVVADNLQKCKHTPLMAD